MPIFHGVNSLIPRPPSKQERRVWQIQYILTLWASCCYESCKGVMSKDKWFVVRKPSTANQIVPPKFRGGTKMLYYIHQTPLSS